MAFNPLRLAKNEFRIQCGLDIYTADVSIEYIHTNDDFLMTGQLHNEHKKTKKLFMTIGDGFVLSKEGIKQFVMEKFEEQILEAIK